MVLVQFGHTKMKELSPYLPIILIALLLFRRTQRSRPINPSWLWATPAVFGVLTALFVYAAIRAHAHWTVVELTIVIAAGAIGALLGAVRAQTLSLARDAASGKIEAKLSMWGLAFLLGWLLLRTLLRESGFTRA